MRAEGGADRWEKPCRSRTGPQVLAKVKKYVRNGSIITFHDSIKSEPRLKYALPRAIEWLLEEGYTFKVF